MIRSQQKNSDVHVALIKLASFSRIKPKAAHELMGREASGRANLGFIELIRKITLEQDYKNT